MMNRRPWPGLALAAVIGASACRDDSPARPLFTLLPADQTGITFVNRITTSDSVNVQTDAFVYNGAGVGAGDFDNDGLIDLFFSGNMVSSRLYLNRGNLEFQDITESAGVSTDRWATGVSTVDINADGYLDIYVSVSGPEWSTPEQRTNLLFLNNHDNTFSEAASTYGIADAGFTTHAAFFDYDGDQDLDLFLLTNSPGEFARGEAERHPAGIQAGDSQSYDRLYRNEGDGTFTDVSVTAGLLREVGFGLGVVVTDLNGDARPDLYVSNDDTPSDVLYVNNGDGTFTDRAAEWLRHTSFAGMGIDIADFNNDGWPDVFQTDMMPEALSARKRMSGATTYSGSMARRARGFQLDYNMNTLQLHGGVTPGGDVIFSEIARMAGVAYTDWSWSALFGDYDNDGYKDILVTNGYPKSVVDYDYQLQMHAVRRAGQDQRALEILDALGAYTASNYAFRNQHDLTFGNVSATWGLDHPGFSYGAAHADLDNDGRLDIVISNIDTAPLIYHNVPPAGDSSHYLQITLNGDAPNPRALGSTVRVWTAGQQQFVYHTPYRGFMSSLDGRLHFGLGEAQRVDSVVVEWPDRRRTVTVAPLVDRIVTLDQRDATSAPPAQPSAEPVFGPSIQPTIPFVHRTEGLTDYSVQPLLPHMVSRQGPPLAVGDVDDNGLQDVYIGGSAGFPGSLFLQLENGDFVQPPDRQPWQSDRAYDDWAARFFDADGDGRLDLYVASGGYHVSPVSALLQDRLYINQGGGTFVKTVDALPRMETSTGSVAAGDFNADGRVDLFVGGRLVPRNYPYSTRSYLLRNDGDGFTDVTETILPELVRPGGMITDAAWLDFTGDGQLDLVTAGEWMPVQFYEGRGGTLRNITSQANPRPLRGWWQSLETGDFNHDGRPDIVAGNFGLNHSFTTTHPDRFGVYAADFTGNRTTDIVFTHEIDGTEYPFFGLARLASELYTIGLTFPNHAAFATASIEDVFESSILADAVHHQVDTFASVYLQNEGNGRFTRHDLPAHAQIAPINAMAVHDVDADGHLDLIVGGNRYETDPNLARQDAGNGLWLRGDGRGNFAAVPPHISGLAATLDVRALALLGTPNGTVVLVANNSDSLQTFRIGTGYRGAPSSSR